MLCICRLVLGLLFALFLWYQSAMRLPDGHFPTYFYVLLFLCSAVHQVNDVAEFLYSNICYCRALGGICVVQ